MAVVELTKENFEEVITSNATVIVDYWAPWCGPCRGFAPVFERVAEKNPDAVFAKVNTDDEQEIAQQFQIRSIPTLMVFRDQIIVFSQPGALPESGLAQVVEKAQQLDMDEVRRKIAQQGEQDSAPSAA
jgi:thioredoxin 1